MEEHVDISELLPENLPQEFVDAYQGLADAGIDIKKMIDDMDMAESGEKETLALAEAAHVFAEGLTAIEKKAVEEVIEKALGIRAEDNDRLRMIINLYQDLPNKEDPAEVLGISQGAWGTLAAWVEHEAALGRHHGVLKTEGEESAWTLAVVIGLCVGAEYGSLRDA